MSGENQDGVAQAIEALAYAVHTQIFDTGGRAIGPNDAHGSPIKSLSEAVTAVAWSGEVIADAINRLAMAIETTKEEN